MYSVRQIRLCKSGKYIRITWKTNIVHGIMFFSLHDEKLSEKTHNYLYYSCFAIANKEKPVGAVYGGQTL